MTGIKPHTLLYDTIIIIAPGYKIGENFIWGATAMIIAELEQLMKTNTFNHLGKL